MIGLYMPILIIIVILFISLYASKVFGAKLLRSNKITKVFAGYLAILVIAAIVSFILPEKGAFDGELLSDKEIDEEQRFNERVYTLIEDGEIESANRLVEKGKWEFPLEAATLNYASQNFQGPYIMTFVERVDELEGKVEAAFYVTRSYIDNVDITERITAPKLKLTGSDLTVYPAESVDLTLAKLSKPFPFGQFSEGNGDVFGFEGLNHGMEFLYLRVPEGTKVVGDVYIIN